MNGHHEARGGGLRRGGPLLLVALLGCGEGPSTDAPVSPGATAFTDGDGDGWAAGPDCDDDDDDVHPGKLETCDGRDDDCAPATREVWALPEVHAVPDGGSAVLCGATHAGNLRLVDRDLTIRGDGVSLTAADPRQPVVEVVGGRVVLEGLGIDGPLAVSFEDGSYGPGYGYGAGYDYGYYGHGYNDGYGYNYEYVEGSGGLRVSGGTLVLRDALVSGHAGQDGGAILAVDGAELILENTDVHWNYAVSDGGGLAVFDSTLTVRGGRIEGNGVGSSYGYEAVGEGRGGGIRAERSTVHLIDTELVANGAAWGGGISTLASEVTLSGVRIDSCHARADGGGAHITGGSLTALDSSLWFDRAYGGGGGLRLVEAEVELVGVDVVDSWSTGANGGGISAFDTVLTADLLWVEANDALGHDGGGVYLYDSVASGRGWTVRGNGANEGGGVLLLRSELYGDGTVLLTGNDAFYGGGLVLVDGSVAEGVEIRGNTANFGGGVYRRGAIAGSRVEGTVAGNAAESGGGVYVVAGNLQLDGKIVGNTADEGGGAWLNWLGTLEGRADWGAGADDNLPDDVRTQGGATWQAEGELVYACDDSGCE